MKRTVTVCLLIIALQTAAPSAQAGPRARTARRTTAIVAAATAPVAVAAATRRTTVVAVAPVPVPVARIKPAPAPLAPDLTIVDIAAEGETLCVTVKNIGQIASPQTRMQLDLVRSIDGGLLGGQTFRVLPLAVGQSVKIRISSVPFAGVEANAVVDPAQEVAELNEQNNNLAVKFAAPAVASELPALEDQSSWGQREVQASVSGRVSVEATR